MMVSKGQPWSFLGIPLSHLASPDRGLARNIQEIHETFGNALMYLAAAHALIAVFHHFIQRDDTLVSNLLVVLCGERGTQPVLNTGTLYQG